MTDEERRAAGWKHISEPKVIPAPWGGDSLYWIEDCEWYKIIPAQDIFREG